MPPDVRGSWARRSLPELGPWGVAYCDTARHWRIMKKAPPRLPTPWGDNPAHRASAHAASLILGVFALAMACVPGWFFVISIPLSPAGIVRGTVSLKRPRFRRRTAVAGIVLSTLIFYPLRSAIGLMLQFLSPLWNICSFLDRESPSPT